jgi:phosphoglycolate phosphatase
MHFEAVVFDLDGTLLDTLEDIANSANNVLAKHGYPTHPVDDYRDFVGAGVTMLITRLLPDEERDDDIIRKCVKAFLAQYSRNWNVKTKPYGGVEDTLNALVARHMKLAVLSNKPEEFTQQCVAEFLPYGAFEMVVGHRNRIPPKPHPAGALHIAECLKVPPGHIAYVGDSAIDMETAIAAGMLPVGALWGFGSLKQLQHSGAKSLIERPEEILDLLSCS